MTAVRPSSGPRTVRAPRGTGLTCRGWQQEAALRMLMNNLDPEVAEGPDNLIVYVGTGRAAWKRTRLIGSRTTGGPLAMLAVRTDAVHRETIGYAQFGPLSAYPRAQSIRDRYPQLPESPAPWVITFGDD